MANQKITDLNRLNNLDADDLFIVVDTDSKSNSASPTGETKGISAGSLASELNKIANSEVGIDFKHLRDVPDTYEENKGGYIKINNDGTGIEFTDSPGASEQVFSGSFLEDRVNGQLQEYLIGDILYVSSNNKFSKASCSSLDMSEAVGIIRKIKYTSNSTDTNKLIEKVSVVFNGYIEFEWDTSVLGGPISIEMRPIDPDDTSITRVYDKQLLEPGKTYFLGTSGSLMNLDPAELVSLDTVVSKPMLVATSKTTGILMNYRGLVCSSDEQSNKFVIYEPSACNSIKTGDILRIKRNKVRTSVDNFIVSSDYDDSLLSENVLPNFIGRESGTTEYALCNSASQQKTLTTTNNQNPPVEDDNYGCDMLGVVINSTSDFFEIQTSGMVEFMPPEYQSNETITLPSGDTQSVNRELQDGLFKTGYTYYVESFPINSDQLASTNQTTELRNSVYDYAPEELSEYYTSGDGGNLSVLGQKLKPLLDGTSPFRNTTIIDPFVRDHTSGKVVSYSKPAFYAVSPNKILILNQPAYPNPKDRCNAVDPTTWTPCTYESRDSQSYTINRPREFTGQTELENFSSDFLKIAWPEAGANDRSVITFIIEYTIGSADPVTRFESHELIKIDSVDGSNWNYVRKLS